MLKPSHIRVDSNYKQQPQSTRQPATDRPKDRSALKSRRDRRVEQRPSRMVLHRSPRRTGKPQLIKVSVRLSRRAWYAQQELLDAGPLRESSYFRLSALGSHTVPKISINNPLISTTSHPQHDPKRWVILRSSSSRKRCPTPTRCTPPTLARSIYINSQCRVSRAETCREPELSMSFQSISKSI